MSQRKLETVFASPQFKTMFNFAVDMKVSHSSILTRLSKIDLSFFEKLYELIYNEFARLYTEKEICSKNQIRVDSSMVAEAGNKLKEGFTVGSKPKEKEARKQIKYTMAYDGFSVKLAEVFSASKYLSEDIAMPDVIMPPVIWVNWNSWMMRLFICWITKRKSAKNTCTELPRLSLKYPIRNRIP